MAKRFNFMKRVDGIVETFYPKTSTDNVVKETSSGEKKLDDILDEKGGFIQFTKQNESTGNDLLFEVLGDVVDSETTKSLRGTVVGNTSPEDTRYLWVDKSTENVSLKFYDSSTETWRLIDVGVGEGTEVTDSDMDIELDSDIED